MDDQMMFVYEEIISEALFNGSQIKITYYDNFSCSMKYINGSVKIMDYNDKCVKLISRQNETGTIEFEKIVGIEMISEL
ncbi:YolD-like family protein [Exiguobacterium sp. s161]|uniref:YolD-like family protein n=1 Tax=Exiguobacterium sp. s161 TaxID=2751191 RepID=UPI001BEBCA01